MLKNKRDRSRNERNPFKTKEKELLDLDNIRSVVSPPYSLRSYNEGEDNNKSRKKNQNKTSRHENIKSNLNKKQYMSDLLSELNKQKKNEEYINPIPQKESGYLLRKRLPHQLSQIIDAMISCHSCNEIESVNYFHICSKDDCRESFCLKCVEKYTVANQTNALMPKDNNK